MILAWSMVRSLTVPSAVARCGDPRRPGRLRAAARPFAGGMAHRRVGRRSLAGAAGSHTGRGARSAEIVKQQRMSR